MTNKYISFSSRICSVLGVFSLLCTPAQADMTAEQHYQRGMQENESAKYIDAIADYDEAIKMKPDYWKAYANRACAEYYLKRYQAGLKDVDLAMAHLPPTKGLTDIKASLEEAMKGGAPKQVDRAQQLIALRALQRLTAISAGGYGGYNRPADGITQMANNLVSHGYKIPNDLVHPSSTPLIHPMQGSLLPGAVSANSGTTLSSSERLKEQLASASVSPSGTTEAVSHAAPLPPSAPPQMTPEQYLERGAERNRAENFTGAISDFDEFIKHDQTNGLAYANRGAAKLRIGDMKGAVDDLEKAIQILPNDPESNQVREQLKLAVDKAKQMLKTAN